MYVETFNDRFDAVVECDPKTDKDLTIAAYDSMPYACTLTCNTILHHIGFFSSLRESRYHFIVHGFWILQLF